MSNETKTDVGSVVSLWRYPVKSMMGERDRSKRGHGSWAVGGSGVCSDGPVHWEGRERQESSKVAQSF